MKKKTDNQLAIFDMDGTILNTLEDLKDSLNASLAAFGMPLRTREEVRCFVGNGIRRLVERGVPSGTDLAQTDQVFDFFNQYYALHCADQTKPYEGILQVLSALQERAIKTAVVSNKTDYAVQALCSQYFSGSFDVAVGAREGVRKKPYPDAVNEILDRLGISPRNAVYIGDSEVDVATAQNAGIDCICVDWGFRTRTELLAAGATRIVSDGAALLQEIVG